MTARLPFAPAFDHLVYLRVFEGCNLHCQHCFIPSNPKRMDADAIARVPAHVASFAQPGQRILLQWHGGEPTLFGPAWMEDAIGRIESAGPDFIWLHGIQTNLLTYGPGWPEVYRRHFAGEVGVSWDQDIRLTIRDRPESSADFEARFWDRFAALKADGLDPYLVVTFTRRLVERWRNPIDLYLWLAEKGVTRLHFERVTRTGSAREHWDYLGLDNAGYSRAMARFLRAYAQWRATWAADSGTAAPIAISPFDGLLQSAARLRDGEIGGYGCWSGKCDTGFHTIDSAGYKRGCTAITSEYDNPRFKGEGAIKFDDPVAARALRRYDCTKCRFKPICSSGCLAVSMDDGSGECGGGYRMFSAAADVVGLNAGVPALQKELAT